MIGPSGCGKSTLLRFIGGLERPHRRRVTLAGEPPAGSLNPLTYIFQDFALLPWRTVEGNVGLVLEDHGIKARRGAASSTTCSPAPVFRISAPPGRASFPAG